ncbi:hypothetical protein [Xylanimonas ulmi]|uniref:Uncharacterized protein n=1 Tax=Xylanimonas ulmi TaxID=228973 RepID=A0A4Q7M711_9MICO|nr:hypothetical protein [Xylanibacterium ulmi]RZS62418.1 hypothetical protein EV386_2751 [Xylanibacterium ulmi]
MKHTHRSHRGGVLAADRSTLLEIAEVLDAVCAARATLDPEAGDDCGLRCALFELLDQPTQELWEQVREMEVARGLLPGTMAYLPGMAAPSPLGLTLGDIVYAFGLPDLVCPSRGALLRALRWAVAAPGGRGQG